MKKTVLSVALLLAGTSSGVPLALAQTPAQPAPQAAPAPQQKRVIKDPAEFYAYVSAVQQTDPAAEISALEAFLTHYPNSAMKEDVLELVRDAYQQVALQNKVSGAGKAAKGKDKRFEIRVLNSDVSQNQGTYVIPGTPGSSETHCTGEIYPRTGRYDTSNDCQTTTTPATSPQTVPTQWFVIRTEILLPDGTRRSLMCQQGEYHCYSLVEGDVYPAELKGKGQKLLVYGQKESIFHVVG